MNYAFAYCYKKARLTTTGGSDIEYNKFLGQTSIIMRFLNSKDGDLLSDFDNFNDADENASIICIPWKQILVDNRTELPNKGNIKGHLYLEHTFGFCKTFKKVTKNLGYHLTFKTNDLQKIIFTTIATDVNITINFLFLYVPIIFPSTDTQVMFNESIQNIYTIFNDCWFTERRISTDGDEVQVDFGTAQHVNSPKYLIASFQTEARIGVPNKATNIAIFDNVNVRKYFCEINSYRYPKDAVLINLTKMII